MIWYFDLNFLFNSFVEIQFSGTRQFCSSQADHSVGSRFLFAQNITSLAIVKNHGLQDLVCPAHQAHSSFTAENFLPWSQCTLIASQDLSRNLIIWIAARNNFPLGNPIQTFIHSLRRQTHKSPTSWALWFVYHSSPKVLVSSTAVNSFSYSIENDG